MKTTNIQKIKRYLLTYGMITKAIAAAKGWSYGLGEVIRRLRERGWLIHTDMRRNERTGNSYAIYKLIMVGK